MSDPADPLAELNFRDLGGLPVAGGTIRAHRLYRCEGPANFTDAQHAALAARDIGLVCDLRSAKEHQALVGGHRWGRHAVNFDIAADFRSGADSNWQTLGSALTGPLVRQRMLGTYRAMPAALLPHLTGLIDAVLAGGVPLLVHCTAGKDRTGVLIAILLRMVGAAPEAIIADYLRSASFGTAERNRARIRRQLGRILDTEVGDDALDAVIGVDGAYVEAALDEIDMRWGSMDGYLAAAGIDAAKRAALRQIFVDEAG